MTVPEEDLGLSGVFDRLARRGAEITGEAASWHVHRTDGEGEWLIRRDPDGLTVVAEHAKADCALRGTGSDLLAFLTGRLSLDGAPIEIFGDAGLAGELPQLCAYG